MIIIMMMMMMLIIIITGIIIISTAGLKAKRRDQVTRYTDSKHLKVRQRMLEPETGITITSSNEKFKCTGN